MLREYKLDDFNAVSVASPVKWRADPEESNQLGAFRRPGANAFEAKTDLCGSDGDTDTDSEVPKIRHRFVPGTHCVLGPKIPGVFDAFAFAMILYVITAILVYVIGVFQFEEELHILIWIMVCWILSGLAAFTATTITDPGIIPPASPEGFRDRVERMTQQEKDTMRVCEECNLIVEYSTRHCPWCKSCCREFDHHCSITGTCVGARNKAHFNAMQFFTAWSSVYLSAIGLIWIAMFFVTREETWDRIVYAGQILARIMQFKLLYFYLCWLSMYFGWWEQSCCGFFPNPFYHFFFRCLRPPRPNRGYNAWKSLVRREELCCKGTKLFTIPERKLYAEEGYNCFHDV